MTLNRLVAPSSELKSHVHWANDSALALKAFACLAHILESDSWAASSAKWGFFHGLSLGLGECRAQVV